LLQKGFHQPADLVGRALPHLRVFSDLDVTRRLVARVDPARWRTCDAGGYQAITMHTRMAENTAGLKAGHGPGHTPGHMAVVDPAVCDGCGLCVGLCRRGAIQLVSKN
jgi:NAD-dependent dihydropyrimidine dehydrogenase PreA subunit